MLLPDFIREGAAALEALYPPEEARSLVLRLCEDLCGFQPFDYIVKPQTEVPEELHAALGRLVDGEPLQYVSGFQFFRGRKFKVSPSVLIPRPETEMLVDCTVRHLEHYPHGAKVLDLCTGSGCIAWSIALEVPGAMVTGVDISEEALAVASSQFAGGAAGAGAVAAAGVAFRAPRFERADLLAVPETFPGAPFDVITANPPYIRESERLTMHTNVLEHEPELALFVPDDDALRFYRAIALWAQSFLKPGGWGIVEINEELGEQTAAVFERAGMKSVTIIPDFFGKDRFVSFEKAA